MHIDKKDLIEFDNGNMNTQEVIEFLSHLDHCDFCLDQMTEQEDSSTDTAPSYLMEQILTKADSGEVQLARAANKASRKMQLLHYSLQTAAGVIVALLLLFSIPNLDFTSLHQDTSSQINKTLPEHEDSRLYQFTRELGQNIGDGTSSFIKYISDFSSKLMNGGNKSMQKQKHGFWLFIFSLIPGAGEMYMGFKKQGISIMFLFWGVFAIGACTGMDWLVFLIPIIWFYSFFNVHNLKSLSEEEFYSIEDSYVLHMDELTGDISSLLKHHRNLTAILLIFLGASILWNNLMDFLYMILPGYLADIIGRFTYHLPQLVIAVAIIFAGIYILTRKKDALDEEHHDSSDEEEHYWTPYRPYQQDMRNVENVETSANTTDTTDTSSHPVSLKEEISEELKDTDNSTN